MGGGGGGGAPEGVEGEPLAGVGEDGLFHEGDEAVLDGGFGGIGFGGDEGGEADGVGIVGFAADGAEKDGNVQFVREPGGAMG